MIDMNRNNQIDTFDFYANSLDLMRFLAALSIISTHLLAHIPPANVILKSCMSFFNSYFYGVVTFFAISGFLVSKSIEKSKSFIEFIKKRILRLYPGIWCAFLVSASIICVIFRPQLNVKRVLIWCVSQLSFFQVYTPGWLRGYGNGTPNGALWTIVVEIQLYIISWMLYKRLQRLSKRGWGCVIGITAVVNIICGLIEKYLPHILYRMIFVSFLPYLYIFFVGMFLYFYRETILKRLTKYWFIVLLGYTIWMTVQYFYLPPIGFYAPIYIGLTLPVMIIVTAYGLGGYRFKYELSYGMYLYHFIIINALIATGHTNGITAIMIVFPLSIMMGFLENVLIDKPILRKIQHRGC